jgi:hypothetical protein
MGRAHGRERGEGRRPLGPGRAVEEKKEGRPWAGLRGKKRKRKRKKSLGRPMKEKEREKNAIQMFLNLNLKFKSK